MKARTTTAVALLAATAALLAGCDDGTSDSKPKAKAPAYKLVERDTDGNQRQVVVEVTSTKRLRAVFDDVVTSLKDDAGYFVSISCSTGGTKKVDIRLANGKYAQGSIGAATTGLDDGGKEFEPVTGRSCPDKP